MPNYRFLALVVLFVAFAFPTFAQPDNPSPVDTDFTMSLVQTVPGSATSAAEVSVILDNARPLSGWVVAVCNPTVICTSVNLGVAAATLNDGLEPEFLVQEILLDGATFFTAVVVDFEHGFVLPTGTGQALHTATFELPVPPSETQSEPLTYCGVETQPGVTVWTTTVAAGEAMNSLSPVLQETLVDFVVPLVVEGFVRADCDLDGAMTMMDGVLLLNYLFLGGEEPSQCLDACDFQADFSLGIGDAVGILSYMFLNNVFPAPPFPECGTPEFLGNFDCTLPECPAP